MKKTFVSLFVLLIVVSLTGAACGATGAQPEVAQQAAPTEASPAETEAAKTETDV